MVKKTKLSIKKEKRKNIVLYNTIGFRFVSFMILITFLSVLIISLVTINVSRKAVRQEILDNNLTQARLVAEFTSNYIEVIQANVESFASRPLISVYINENNYDAAADMLEEFVQIQTVLDTCGLYNTSGIQLALSNPNATTLGQVFVDRDWFQQAIATRKPHQSIPIKSRATGNAIAVYSVPIINEQDQIIAVLAGSISLEKLSDVIIKINKKSDVDYTIFDARNESLIIANKNSQLILSSLTERTDVVSLVLNNESGSLEVENSGGAKELIGYAPIPNLPWGILITTLSRTAFSSLNSLTQIAISISIITILIAAMICGLFVRQITVPLSRLVEETKEIGKGNLDHKIMITGKGETKQLSQAFSSMTDSLKKVMVSKEELKESQAFLHAALDNSQIGIMIADAPTGKLRYTNNVIFSIRDKSKEEIVGYSNSKNHASSWNLFHFDGIPYKDEEVPLTRTVKFGEVCSEELIVRRDNQEDRYVLVNTAPIKDKDKKIIAGISFFIDITEKKKWEQEKILTEIHLRNQQKLESIGTLASGVAHEINNPINGIMNYGQLILDTKLGNDKIDEYASEIINETNRISKIVRNLLDFSRQRNQEYSYTNIEDIMSSTLSLIRTIYKHDQIQLNLEIDANLPMINCQSHQIQQVIMNFLTNARDALNQSYPQYDENKIVNIYCSEFSSEGRKWIKVTVEDFGIGISDKIKNNIFDPFYTTKGRTKGTGLGLSISYGIIKEHHGEIIVESEENKYTRFIMTLPCDNSDKHNKKDA